jgi:hypothetical protein
MITDYKIAFGVESEDLANNVCKLITKGYQPFGSPFKTTGYFHQAMIREGSMETFNKMQKDSETWKF